MQSEDALLNGVSSKMGSTNGSNGNGAAMAHTPDARPDCISKEEWTVRCDLAALYRLLGHFKYTDHIYTHISARVPGPEPHFLINRWGILFDKMRASDLVKIDYEGNRVDDFNREYPINDAGFVIHSAVHMARPDVHCVVHTHTANGVGVCAMECGLLSISQISMKFFNKVGYHVYEGIALDIDERKRLIENLGNNDVMILRNHGLLATGRSIPDAFHMIYSLEQACAIQIAALSGGGKLTYPLPDVCQKTAEQFEALRCDEHYGLVWPASLGILGDSLDYAT
eukprot:TRINITY_DN32658_c0_g1_i1.p2 TRINITY_DN32658_c0_g1~~TRINITY_DN32658_c0_g1_i1.p2  ORF type:complete len:283 (+),score=42.49 TRINITY_DN32658_c0_g1_i1:497-1345(+)